MTTREITNEYRRTQWTQRLMEQKSSGQSIREWCEINGIKRHQFFYWQKRLREMAAGTLTVQAKMQPITPSGWSLCTTEADPPRPAAAGLTIKIGNCRVVVEPGFEPELLKEVCSVLSSIC